jgi:hypothetical protein
VAGKQYGAADQYEKKLEMVMKRFNVESFDFDWNRKGHCWIKFTIDGELFYFSHSVEQAKAAGIELKYGSDAFAQLVLTLEDLARANERRTFVLKKILGAMAMLEPPKEIPQCFKDLGFDEIPVDTRYIGAHGQVIKQYRSLSHEKHPDNGGSNKEFVKLQESRDACLKYFEGK